MRNCLRRALALLMLAALLPAFALGEITEENGRLTGYLEADAPMYEFEGILYFDCAVPEAFTAETWKLLSVEYPALGKADLAQALEAAGTKPVDGAMTLTNTGPMSRWLRYDGERHMDLHEMPAPEGGHPNTQEQGALSVALRALDALSIEVDRKNAQAYTYDNPIYQMLYLNGNHDAIADELQEAFDAAERAAGRDPARYTVVSARPALLGLPVSYALFYADGDAREPTARMGIFSDIQFIVRDDGVIAKAMLSNIPRMLDASPIDAPMPTWRDALNVVDDDFEIACLYGNKDTENQLDELTGMPNYGQKSTVTQIDLCWVAAVRGELRPGFRFTITQTRANDGRFAGTSEYCVDAFAMEPID